MDAWNTARGAERRGGEGGKEEREGGRENTETGREERFVEPSPYM